MAGSTRTLTGAATAASRQRPCLTIYDDGEGQHPENFEKTFLSLLQGNKNEIAFVQGKYNMGGTGAIVFCGEHRYQLIGSKRYDGAGEFGFTLIRRHPLSAEEKKTKKNTWYEYLKIDGKIPSFPITELDLGLAGRKFTTGTIIKLFDYQLPAGSSVLRNFISRQGAIGMDQKELSDKKYISSIYFHTIFLFSITKNKKYELKQGEKDVDLQDYLRDVFSSYYSEFLLNFGMEDLIASMAV